MVKFLKSRNLNNNSLMFMITYGLMGMLYGVLFDVLVTYLQIVSPDTANSMSLYVGLGSFIGSCIMLFVSKLGYKNIMIAGPIFLIISLLFLSNSNNSVIIIIATLVMTTGVLMFDIILPPFLSLNTSSSNRTTFFNRAMYLNLMGSVVGTVIEGPIIVWRFSKYLNVPFSEAKLLTEQVKALTDLQKQSYINAHRYVLLLFIVILCLCIIPVLFMRESERSHIEGSIKKEKNIVKWNFLFNKFVFMYLIYVFLCKFSAYLIIPYVSLYLSQVGVNRASVSVIVTAQYFAAFLFMLVSPHIIRKIGRVKSLGWMCLASVPFMIIIGSASSLPSNIALILGTSLFFRSGFSNANNSVAGSLPMDLVSEELRPTYNSIIFITQGVAQGVSGVFTKQILFKHIEGYSQAYFLAAAIFILAHIILLMYFTKPYNNLKKREDNALAL